ncbi:hypothetical protein HYU11_03055 [Candidatus Woesearchaeota archaeon]|nr:hypothetical protein [Candidatus Woesearchaeota archaeon]
MIKSISISEHLNQKVELYARENGHTFSGLVTLSLERFLLEKGAIRK